MLPITSLAGFWDGIFGKTVAHSLCDSKQYRCTIYTTKSSNNAPWYRAQNNGRQLAVFSTNATNSRAKFALICNYCQAFEYNSISCDKCVQLELLRINIGTRCELQEQA